MSAESEVQLAAAERVAQLGSWSWDVVNDVVHFSEQMLRLLGLPLDTAPMTLDDVLAFTHPPDVDGVRAAIERTLGSGEPFFTEGRMVRADGTLRLVRATGQATLDAELRPVALIGVVQDITESVAAEAALRESEQRFRLLAENAHDVVYRYLVAPESRFDYISPSVERVSGYRPDEFYADPSVRLRVIHPDDHHLLRPEMQPAPLRAICKDGTVIWVELQSVAVRDSEGRVVALQGIARDITGRKRAEDELRLLQDITVAVAEAIDMHSALGVALQQICETTGWAYGGAWVPRGDDSRLQASPAWYAAVGGLERFREITSGTILPAGKGLPGRAWQSAQPEWIPELSTVEDCPRMVVAQELGLATGIAIPVLDDGRVIAVLEFVLTERRVEDAHLLDLVSGAARQLGNVISRKEAEARLAFHALHDQITGLANRDLFVDFLTRGLVRADRRPSTVVVLCVNIDGFKRVNESLGHRAGDGLLLAVAERLSSVLRPEDTIARLGADEFVVLAEDITDEHEAMAIASRIRDGLEAPFAIEHGEVYLTASVGIAIPGDDRPYAESLIRDANLAMHRAKETGRGACQLFDKQMHARSVERLELERDLRRAVERHEFQLAYQPEIDLTTGAVTALEALLRWDHPTRGPIPPLDFIPLAEETGLILTIGEWVLREACRQAARLNMGRRNTNALRVWVNLSARQLADPSLVSIVISALRDANADPSTIGLEITESVLMEDAEGSVRTLQQLRELGVRLAIDDFGTGYSSLAYLKRLPVEVLKIDRAFVRGLGDDPDDSTIVASVISLAHSLGVAAVAEGVETWTQLNELDLLGCDTAQGYYFARPGEVSDVMLATRFRTIRRGQLGMAETAG